LAEETSDTALFGEIFFLLIVIVIMSKKLQSPPNPSSQKRSIWDFSQVKSTYNWKNFNNVQIPIM
jgi:hypothetical protein